MSQDYAQIYEILKFVLMSTLYWLNKLMYIYILLSFCSQRKLKLSLISVWKHILPSLHM